MEKCKRCQCSITEDEHDEHGHLCYDCFEISLEEYEERRRERIARENEY